MVSYAIHYLGIFCIGKVTGIVLSPFPVHASCKTALYRIFYSTMLWIVDEMILDHRVYKREGDGGGWHSTQYWIEMKEGVIVEGKTISFFDIPL